MTRTHSQKFKVYLRLLAPLVFSALQSLVSLTASAQGQAPKQHFVCNIGYTPQQCREAMDVLRQVLAKYPATDVGEWTWVLVRPEDWRHILLERGLSPDRIPAFTILSQRETLLEGALVTKVSYRGVRLTELWRMPIADLLDLAVRHELAHAFCNDRDELKADRVAIALKNHDPLPCQSIRWTKTTTKSHEKTARDSGQLEFPEFVNGLGGLVHLALSRPLTGGQNSTNKIPGFR